MIPIHFRECHAHAITASVRRFCQLQLAGPRHCGTSDQRAGEKVQYERIVR